MYKTRGLEIYLWGEGFTIPSPSTFKNGTALSIWGTMSYGELWGGKHKRRGLKIHKGTPVCVELNINHAGRASQNLGTQQRVKLKTEVKGVEMLKNEQRVKTRVRIVRRPCPP